MVRKHILIVDDDPEIRHTLRKRLAHNGFDCDSASSVEAALQACETEEYDLILLDLGFTGLDGTTFLKTAFQHHAPHKKIPPVVVLSCYSDQEIVDHVLQSGAVAFVAKPYDAQELLATIRLLTRAPAPGSSVPPGPSSEAPL